MVISNNATGGSVIQASSGSVKPLRGKITVPKYFRCLGQNYFSLHQISLIVPAQAYGSGETVLPIDD